MFRKLVPLLVAVALGALAPSAHAQPPRVSHGAPVPRQEPRPQAQPSEVAQRTLQVAVRELGQGPVTDELGRLVRMLERIEGRGRRGRGHGRGHGHGHEYGHAHGRDRIREVGEQYQRVQGALAATVRRTPPRLGHALADLESQLRYAGYLPAYPPPPPPRPYPQPPYPQQPQPPYPQQPYPQASFRFDGQFEALPIAFVADSPDGIFQACKAQSGAFSSAWVDEIQVAGQPQRNGSGYWSVDALCAIAALNAQPMRMHIAIAPVAGQVESVPFRIVGDRDVANDLLRRYLPVALQNEWVDDVSVGGQSHRNPSGWWNLDQIVQIVLSHFTGVYH